MQPIVCAAADRHRVFSPWAGLVACSLLLAGCQSSEAKEQAKAVEAIRAGGVKADLQRYFDGRRECAPVLEGGETGLLRAEPGGRVAAALQRAGLIVPVADNDPAAESFRPAPAAARWFSRDRWGIRLCYGQRKIDAVLLDAARPAPWVRYTFVLGDLPPWTRDPALVAAVPALSAVASGVEILGSETLPVKNGKVDTGLIQDTAANPTLFEFGMNFRNGIILRKVQQ